MGQTTIEKIFAAHAGGPVRAGEIVELDIDVRIARDFGGPGVVRSLRAAGLAVADPARTFFTFDCNPGGSDPGYAAGQQLCRGFAREQGVTVYDVDAGIGSHLAIDEGLVVPGSTAVSTDSHANLLGAIGAFGQGMGELDVAQAFARGRVWFRVPPTVRVVLRGRPGRQATAKDLALAVLRRLGARGLLGRAAELAGPAVEHLSLAGRITMASMATEMGAIAALIEPSEEVLDFCRRASRRPVEAVWADPDADYEAILEVDVEALGALLSRPGRPGDVVELETLRGTPIDSVFIGSCTNGRYPDLEAAAAVLRGRRVADGVVLKVVPATDRAWRRCLESGVMQVLKEAGALIGNAGCGGCAAGQIGQNGPGEVTVSTGNRNFPGKQGQGEVFLASPPVAAASAVAGVITDPQALGGRGTARPRAVPVPPRPWRPAARPRGGRRPAPATRIEGRVWVVRRDDIDTDMIFPNRFLTVSEISEMARHAFGNLAGWEDFARRVRPGDIVVAGANFGAGSSRQQAVDCFRGLGVALLVAVSFAPIYERNAINSGFPILCAPLLDTDLADGQRIEVDLRSGVVLRDGGELARGRPWPAVQWAIYRRGGLLAGEGCDEAGCVSAETVPGDDVTDVE